MKRVIVAVLATLLVAGATTATAKSLLTSKDIKDESIQNRDLADGAFTWSKLRDSTQRKIERMTQAGAKGDKGDTGATGPQGAKGDKGDPGQALVANATTQPDPSSPGGLPLLALHDYDLADDVPSDGDPGQELVGVTLDPGTYLISGAAQFLNLNNGADGNPNESFGAARLFVDGAAYGATLFSNNLPDSNSVLAQTTGTATLTVTHADTRVTMNAVSRGQSGTYGGANLIVTRITSAAQ